MRQTLIDNRYALGHLLGSGGMAEVYLAHDEVLDRDVALKILRKQYAHDEEFVKRFRREAQNAAALNHPNIVSVYDRGRSEDGTYYIAMEHVPSGTLKEHIAGPLEPDTAVELASQVAGALGYAHERGVIHRDVKPQNILLTASGDVKVADFGIARAAAATTTTSNLILGTAGYMSPEQAMGEPVGPRSDLYSLGVVLYEMLTGKLPYGADSPMDAALKHVNEPPRSPREANPDVPEALDALTVKLLAKNPEDRYASADDLINDLERARSGLPPAAIGAEKTTLPLPASPGAERRTAETVVEPPPAAAPVGVPGREKRRGKPFLTLAALLLGATLLGGLAWTLTQGESGAPKQGSSGNESGAEHSGNESGAEQTAPDSAGVPGPVYASGAEDIAASKGPEQAPAVQAAPVQAVPAPSSPALTPPAHDKKAENKQKEAEKKGKKKTGKKK